MINVVTRERGPHRSKYEDNKDIKKKSVMILPKRGAGNQAIVRDRVLARNGRTAQDSISQDRQRGRN